MRRRLPHLATSLSAAVVAALLALSGCSLVREHPTGEGVPPGRAPVRSRLRAVSDPVAGGRIVDSAGRTVTLRGVNVNALADYWRYGPFPTTFPLTASDADLMAAEGWNVARLLVSWSRVEPEPGVYDGRYLDEVAEAVRLLAGAGVYSVIDFHQDAWGPTLAAAPGEPCPSGSTPAFGWDGAPGWATLDGGAARCVVLGSRELSPAVLVAFDAFWRDAAGAGGVGIRTRYRAMVAHVAGRFAHDPSVAGYDLMNEPNAYGPAQLRALSDLAGETLTAVRAAERRVGGFPHLLLVEPSIVWSDDTSGMFPPFPHDGGVVFAPHIYRGGLSAGPVQESDFARARSDAGTLGGVPVLVGEWGADPGRAADPSDDYFRRHQELQDRYGFSSTLWTFHESCGDPHKAGAARAGQVPRVWGVFEVDCRTNAVTGLRTPLLAELRRGYVRAAPGRLMGSAFDPATGSLVATGEQADPGVRLEAFLAQSAAAGGDAAGAAPRPRARPLLRGTGLAGLRARPVPGGWDITATARGGTWSLHAAPAGTRGVSRPRT